MRSCPGSIAGSHGDHDRRNGEATGSSIVQRETLESLAGRAARSTTSSVNVCEYATVGQGWGRAARNAATRISLGHLQRLREWIILWVRHDSGTKGGSLLSRHKNNRNGCPELTAMSFPGIAASPFRLAVDGNASTPKMRALSSAYGYFAAGRLASARRLVRRVSAGHRVPRSCLPDISNHCRSALRGSDNASRWPWGASTRSTLH